VLGIDAHLAFDARQVTISTSSEKVLAPGVTISSLRWLAISAFFDFVDAALHVEVPSPTSSCLPSRISLKPRTVSATGTCLPSRPVKTCATVKGWLRKR
jgi:hypothetical protein